MPPRGSSWSRAKYDRCVTKVKRRGSAYNPYAVCGAAAKRRRRVHGNPAPRHIEERRRRFSSGDVELRWFDAAAGRAWALFVDRGDGSFEFTQGPAAAAGASWHMRDRTGVDGAVTSDGTIHLADADLRRIGLEGRLMLEAMLDRAAER